MKSELARLREENEKLKSYRDSDKFYLLGKKQYESAVKFAQETGFVESAVAFRDERMAMSDMPIVAERFTDNGMHSHWEMLNPDTGEIIACEEQTERLQHEIEKLKYLIRDLSDNEPCWFDHHGGCQAHGYLSLKPGEKCPMGEANAIAQALASGGGEKEGKE